MILKVFSNGSICHFDTASLIEEPGVRQNSCLEHVIGNYFITHIVHNIVINHLLFRKQ